MKAYVARDWTGVHLFKTEPRLMQCGGCGEIWSGYRIKQIESLDLLDKYRNISGKQPIKIELTIISNG
jgi:hypothetical protein